MYKPPQPDSVALRVQSELKDDGEKPDDYDKVRRPMRVLWRLLLLPVRVLKGAVLALWRRLLGPRPKP